MNMGSRSVVPTFENRERWGNRVLPVQAKNKAGPAPAQRSALSAGSVMIQSGGDGFHNGAGCVIVFESPDVCAAQAVVPAFVHVEHFEADGKRILEVPESV